MPAARPLLGNLRLLGHFVFRTLDTLPRQPYVRRRQALLDLGRQIRVRSARYIKSLDVSLSHVCVSKG